MTLFPLYLSQEIMSVSRYEATFDLGANMRYHKISLKYKGFGHRNYSMILEEIRSKPM